MKKSIQNVVPHILTIRNQNVILDADLAILYGVTTKRLNEQVKRNKQRFPSDFMFQLSLDEKAEVVAICDHLTKLKFSKTLPYAFTEHGAIMAANVLSSTQAIDMSVFVVRAFVSMRQQLTSNKAIMNKLSELERKLQSHDTTLGVLVGTIRKLLQLPKTTKRRPIGFTANLDV